MKPLRSIVGKFILLAVFIALFVSADEKKVVHPPEYYIQLGDKALTSGKYLDSIKEYTEALDSDRENVKALSKRAEVYSLNHQYSFANADLNTLIKIAPTNMQVDFLKWF
jgi:Tfp pilus assembly protein PilF